MFFNGGVDHTNVQGISNIVVNNGMIRTDNWGQWNPNLNLTVNGPGVFEMWNTSVSLANLSGNGIVQNTKYWGRSQTLAVAAGSFSGSIIDSGMTSGEGYGYGDTRIHLFKSTSARRSPYPAPHPMAATPRFPTARLCSPPPAA